MRGLRAKSRPGTSRDATSRLAATIVFPNVADLAARHVRGRAGIVRRRRGVVDDGRRPPVRQALRLAARGRARSENAALRDLQRPHPARHRPRPPRDTLDLGRIHGVGPAKIASYGRIVLEVVVGFAEAD